MFFFSTGPFFLWRKNLLTKLDSWNGEQGWGGNQSPPKNSYNKQKNKKFWTGESTKNKQKKRSKVQMRKWTDLFVVPLPATEKWNAGCKWPPSPDLATAVFRSRTWRHWVPFFAPSVLIKCDVAIRLPQDHPIRNACLKTVPPFPLSFIFFSVARSNFGCKWWLWLWAPHEKKKWKKN